VSLEQSHRDPRLLHVVGPDRGPAGDLTVRVDKQQLGRALVNLYDNADRHAGGVRAVTVERLRDRVRIDVDDHGDGVPEADRERIFERFVRAGSRGSLPGSGLGLSIVAETAVSLGGRVWCEDAPGGGARFIVELPVAPRQAPATAPVAEQVGARS
jgi:signal transduction histidine kinase